MAWNPVTVLALLFSDADAWPCLGLAGHVSGTTRSIDFAVIDERCVFVLDGSGRVEAYELPGLATEVGVCEREGKLPCDVDVRDRS